MNELFTLKPSRLYFVLALSIYVLSLIISTLYGGHIALKIFTWLIIFYLAFRFFPNIISFKNKKDIVAFRINEKQLTLYYQDKDQKNKVLPKASFQSGFCIILPIEKRENLIIFADSLSGQNLAKVRQMLTIYTNQ